MNIKIEKDSQSDNIKIKQHQYKLSTDLIYFTQKDKQTIETMEKTGYLKRENSIPLVHVYIYLYKGAKIDNIRRYIHKLNRYSRKFNLATAWVTAENLEELGINKNIRVIRPVLPPVVYAGSIVTEGDALHRTDLVRSELGYRGAGIKVGIISDGVNTRSTSQATGDLPYDGSGLTVLSDDYTGDEGTAMLEIVHDMVPDAELFFHDYSSDMLGFNDAIDALIEAGCDIVCDDIGWLGAPYFEDGVIASHITTQLAANNIIYVSSAGNSGDTHYQGDFYASDSVPSQHDFSHGSSASPYLYLNIPKDSRVILVFQWNDAFGASGNDYDLYLYSFKRGLIVSSSTYLQNGDDDPIEFIDYTAKANTAGDFAIIVEKYSGADKIIEVFIYEYGSTNTYTNNITPVDAIFGHAAASDVVSTGAIRASDPGNDDIEYFSSQGPSTISHPVNDVRNTPKLSGIDGVSVTGAGGFPVTFYGTSAAAPHVAAVAAQIWSHNPAYNRDQVLAMMYSSAVDLGSTGFDNVFGWGRADAYATFMDNSLPVVLSDFTATLSKGNIQLNWITESECSNRGFIIERKLHNKWTEIASYINHFQLKGKGHSTEPTEYIFVDTEIIPDQTYFYRLTDVNNKGEKNVHDENIQQIIFPAKDEINRQDFTLTGIYPNPFNPVTNISYQLPKTVTVRINIYDLKGNLMEQLVNKKISAGKHEVSWNAENYPGGIYFIEINNGKTSIVNKCLLIK